MMIKWQVMIQVSTQDCELDFAWKSMFVSHQEKVNTK